MIVKMKMEMTTTILTTTKVVDMILMTTSTLIFNIMKIMVIMMRTMMLDVLITIMVIVTKRMTVSLVMVTTDAAGTLVDWTLLGCVMALMVF